MGKRPNAMQLFPSRELLMLISVDIVGPLPKSKSSRRFLLVITDRFTKLAQPVSLRKIYSYTVAQAFTVQWVFKYGAPEMVLADN